MAARPNLHHAEHGWIDHNGRDCPVHPDTIVRLCFAYGHMTKEEGVRAGGFIWKRRGLPFDIASYMIVQEAEEA
jgi:hypothetical protein